MKVLKFLRSHKLLVFFVLFFICAFVLTGTVKCEILTLLHKNEFSDPELYIHDTMLYEAEYLKVLKYSDNSALIYYIDIYGALGSIVLYRKKDGKWKLKDWDAVWSNVGGSADGALKPYWWHCFTRGFLFKDDEFFEDMNKQ